MPLIFSQRAESTKIATSRGLVGRGTLAVGFRFRRSVKLLPGIRLNFSKSGISTSLGGSGASINIGPKGIRKTIGLPGSGMSYSTFSSHGSKLDEPSDSASSSTAAQGSSSGRGRGCGCIAIVALLLVGIATCSQKPSRTGDPAALPSDATGLAGNVAKAESYAAGDTVYVSSGTLNARSRPSTSSRVVDRLHSGQPLRVVDTKGDWLKVAQGAALFWIMRSHVSGVAPVASQAPQSLMAPAAKHSRSAKHSTQRRNFSDDTCPCSGSHICIGPRGGRYCITSGGNKRYGV